MKMSNKTMNSMSVNCNSKKCLLDQSTSGTLSLSGNGKKNSEFFFTGRNTTLSNTTWFPKQNLMFENADKKGHQFYIARDIKNGDKWVKEYSSFKSTNDYLKWNEGLREESKNCYELLRESLPCKPVFDIEWYGYPDGKESHQDEIYMMVEEHILAVFNDLGVESEKLEIVPLESHRLGENPKYSYHAIINGVQLKNHHQYGKRLAELVVEKINLDTDSPLHSCLDSNGNTRQPVDSSIYTMNRLIRLCGHHKQNERDRPLVPCAEREARCQDGYLVTAIDTNSIMVDIEIPIKTSINVEQKYSTKPILTNNKLKSYLDIIDVSQCQYNDWLKVGIALYIEYKDSGIELWDYFSRRFACYDRNEIESCWRCFNDGRYSNVTVSIKDMAKQTNPSQFIEYTITQMNKDIHRNQYLKALTGIHDDVANLVSAFMDNSIMTCDGLSRETKLWYYFNKHYWVETDGRANVRKTIRKLVVTYLEEKRAAINDIIDLVEDSEENNKWKVERESIAKLIKSLGTDGYKQSITNILKYNCYQHGIYDKFDQDISLFGCTNGVYDLKQQDFRPGQKDDLITVTTELDYLTGDEEGNFGLEHPKVIAIEQFFRQIQPNDSVRKYLQLLLGSCLCGRNILEHVYILTGKGSNGKSKLLELLDYALGKHSASINISYFTGKRPPSNQATPEVEAIANARLVTASEAEEGERFNIDILKRASGNDKITYRGLHRPIRNMIPKFTLIFAVNHLPKLPPDGEALWRRVRVINFNSIFVNDPDPSKPNQYRKDYNINEKLQEWKHAMLWLLLRWHHEFKEVGLKDIPEVMEATQNYQTSQDPIKTWLDESIEVTTNEKDCLEVKVIKSQLMSCDLYRKRFKKDAQFIDYLKEQYPSCKYVKEQTFINSTDRKSNFFRCLKLTETNILDDETNNNSHLLYHKSKVFNRDFVSNGEKICNEVLKDLYPTYIFSKVRPQWLKNPKTGKELELDFYNEELKIAIEYNGIQHYQFVSDFHRNGKNFVNQQERDIHKIHKCKENGIKLITVPYTCNSKETVRNFIEKKIATIVT